MNQPALAAPPATTVPIELKAQIPGHAMAVLPNGTVLVGRVVAAAVRLKLGVKDKDGNPVYDVDWSIDTGMINAKG